AHDGFTLHDLVSYDDKHNEANGEGNRDGHSHNLSWNHGVEGPTGDPVIRALRERQKRNLLATLLFAQGTPMLLAGDEFGRTQHGNNNPYCQDNEVTWLDWTGIDADGRALLTWVREAVALRQSTPLLRCTRWLRGVADPNGVKDITWITPAGTEKTPEQWRDPLARCVGMLLDGRAEPLAAEIPVPQVLLLVLNAHWEPVPFTIPEVPGGRRWRRLLDTARPAVDPDGTVRSGDVVSVEGRSLSLFSLGLRNGASGIIAAADALARATAVPEVAGD
ncbi:MAG TPA: glycogen debranching enzyme GlgX, partial [Azospirillaceae bacterium]|nr:glycogen debranching enzyme GlgX [Azospirillaceae bacterium]